MDPFVVKEKGIYKMYYAGYNGSKYQLGLAYSNNGIKFKYNNPVKYAPIKIGNKTEDIRYPYILKETINDGGVVKNFYRMYYTRYEVSGGAKRWVVHIADSKPLN
jgi:hypothetical protein